MFDAKSLIEMMMRGAAPQQPQAQGGGGGLADILGKMMQQGGGQQGGQQQGGGGLADILGKLGGAAGGQQGGQAGSQGGGLGDILGNILGGGAAGGQAQRPNIQGGAPGGGGMGGLEDLLRKAQQQMGGSGQGGQGGSLMDILGQVLGQATSGVKEGARRIDDATGASGHIGGAVRGATGQSPDDILAQIKDWVSKNQMGAGAAAGGLGAVVLGTKTGRSLAGQAIKLGGLALIGGLAYKALQNYQAGKPIISGPDSNLMPAPQGSGYDVGAVTNESATLYIRAMIAAAAADGRIDANEQQKIIGSLKQAGADAEAEAFIAQELNSPATTDELASSVSSAEEAVQVFTAARIAVDLDTEEEHAFLVDLANKLGIEGRLAQHIDAAARQAA
ncbi:MAG TPA: DUF533 domain-containing protein [Hyphomicrobiaceae bacterium]|nr:DUF533 domain-containing protein [Hyphomicrobiaceae bacterium]